MVRAEVQEKAATLSVVRSLPGREVRNICLAKHISISLNLSTPQFSHISLPGMNARKRRGL